jgi:DNA-binding MarR family transcriptional regulator
MLKRIFELEPYAVIEKPSAGSEHAAWVFIHRRDWADKLVASTRTISRSLAALEALGLIERQQAFQSRGWGREVHVCLTSNGRIAAHQLCSNKPPPGHLKADAVAAGCRHHGSSKRPSRQHISEREKRVDTDLREERENHLHSPDGDCSLGEGGKFQGRSEREEGKGEGRTTEAQLEALFRHCFETAFPEARVQVATDRSLQDIVALAREVRHGEWTLLDIEEVWSRVFPMWWRFVTDTGVRTNDRKRPDRYCAVTYLSEMHNYLLDHAGVLEQEAALGPLAPSILRRAVADAYLETGGIRNLEFRDPTDAVDQLYAMADYLRDYGVTSEEGVRFVARIACHFGQAGSEGSKYWTPEFENIGSNVRAYLVEARRARREASIKAGAAKCVREFAARTSPQLAAGNKVEELLKAEMDEATRLATCIALADGKGDPIKLFKAAFCVGAEVPS